MNISTYLPDDLLAEVDHYAGERGLSRSSIIRNALEQYLARNQPTGWPAEIQNWNGDPSADLKVPASLIQSMNDPFAHVIRSL